MKSGWKTTEFWAMAVGSVVAIVNQAIGLNLPTEAIVGIAVAIAGYALSRGMAKQNQPPAKPPK